VRLHISHPHDVPAAAVVLHDQDVSGQLRDMETRKHTSIQNSKAFFPRETGASGSAASCNSILTAPDILDAAA
jgi:hypothetical protein